MKVPGAEMHVAIHDLLAERSLLQAEVLELTVQLEVARQMLRGAVNTDVQIHSQLGRSA